MVNYDYLTVTTNKYFVPKVVDNIYDSSILFKMLVMDGRIKEYKRGGERIVQPLRYEKPTAAGKYSNWDTFNVTPPDNLDGAEFYWASYYSSIAISGDDEDKNMGDQQIINLVADRTQDAEDYLKDILSSDLFEGTASDELQGLNLAVAQGTYGNIAGGTYLWWRSGVSSTTHTEAQLIDPTDTTHYFHKLLRTAVRTATHKQEKINLIVMPQLLWDIYETTLQASARYPKTGRGQKIADAGFNVLEFRNIPVVADEICTAGYVYFLNTNYMTLYLHPNKNFKFTGFKVPTNQDGRIGQILVKMQLAISNRRMFYKYSGFPTS